jgi:hypothetical protein
LDGAIKGGAVGVNFAALGVGPGGRFALELAGAIQPFIHDGDGLVDTVLGEKGLGKFEQEMAGFGIDFDIGDEVGRGFGGGERAEQTIKLVDLAADDGQLFRLRNDRRRIGGFLLCGGLCGEGRNQGNENEKFAHAKPFYIPLTGRENKRRLRVEGIRNRRCLSKRQTNSSLGLVGRRTVDARGSFVNGRIRA